MKTTGSFKRMMCKIMIAICAVLLFTAAYSTDLVDPLVQEARLKAADGDLESSALLYHEAIKKDSQNAQIRGELAQVIVKAQVREPQADVEPEVIEAIAKGAKTAVD